MIKPKTTEDLDLFGHESVELRLIGNRTLLTRSGKEVHESTAFEAYWIPVSKAQELIKAARPPEQLSVFIDYLRQVPEDGYWIASTDEQDEQTLISYYGKEIKDQHINKIVRQGDDRYAAIQEATKCYILSTNAYSYLFVADLPEADVLWRLVDKLIDDEYELSFQICATMTTSTTPEASIV